MSPNEQPLSSTPATLPSGGDTPLQGQPGQGSGGKVESVLTGQVTDAQSQPLAQVLVAPQSQDSPPHDIPEIAVLTDTQGRYRWILPPGTYRVTFSRDGFAPTIQQVQVVQGAQTTLDATMQTP